MGFSKSYHPKHLPSDMVILFYGLSFEPRHEKNQSSGFPTRSDTNWPVQSQKKATCLRFRILEEEGLYFRCSENKGADQLRIYCEADLICAFVFAYAIILFAHDAAHLVLITYL